MIGVEPSQLRVYSIGTFINKVVDRGKVASRGKHGNRVLTACKYSDMDISNYLNKHLSDCNDCLTDSNIPGVNLLLYYTYGSAQIMLKLARVNKLEAEDCCLPTVFRQLRRCLCS